jgi:hypothetical protein
VYYLHDVDRGVAMQDQPDPSPEEEEQVPEQLEEHEAMRGPGHEEPPEIADEEIHDA